MTAVTPTSSFPPAAVPHTVGLCETQPATAEGVRSLLQNTPDLQCPWSVNSLPLAAELVRQQPPDLLLLDKSIGLPAILGYLESMKPAARPQTVVWCMALSEQEALRLLQAGARGVLRKSADTATLLACLRAIASGGYWMEDCIFQDSTGPHLGGRRILTVRERQVLDLVELGMKNREIASELGIRPGTVKIHLKHIFEKTGVRGRYGLALTVLREQPVRLRGAAVEALG